MGKVTRSVMVDEDVWYSAMVRARREWRMSMSELVTALLIMFVDGRLDKLLMTELGRAPRNVATFFEPEPDEEVEE